MLTIFLSVEVLFFPIFLKQEKWSKSIIFASIAKTYICLFQWNVVTLQKKTYAVTINIKTNTKYERTSHYKSS